MARTKELGCMSTRASRVQRYMVRLANVLAALGLIYVTASVGLAMILAYQPQMPITQTPASLGLRYREVTFFSRDDSIPLHGWFLPGVFPDGRLTVERTVVLVHGMHANRATNLML